MVPNGQVIGYIITYTGTKDNHPPHHLEEPIRLNASTNHYIVQNLTDGYKYVFEVKLSHP